jgi:hypothetical protein
MANTTFQGPVRSENGFTSITKNSTTGAITIRPQKPSLAGQADTLKNTAGTVTYLAGLNRCNFTGAAAQVTTLPAATLGTICTHVQTVDTAGGTNTLRFDCAGTDTFEAGQVIESRGSSAVTFDTSVATDTKITFTPANAATNLLSIGSYIYFVCYTEGKWTVSMDLSNYPTGTTGTMAFS